MMMNTMVYVTMLLVVIVIIVSASMHRHTAILASSSILPSSSSSSSELSQFQHRKKIYNTRSSSSLTSSLTNTSSPSSLSLLSCSLSSTEYTALVDLYTSTNGTGWSSTCAWQVPSIPNYAAPCNGWYGVTCNNQCQVSQLYLNTCNMKGNIPSSLGNLTALIKLDLNSNSLSGTIPSSLGNLTGLINFRIRSNSLTGTIPSSLGNLTKLINLRLDSNSLTGTIPSSFGSLTGLSNLYLNINNLIGTIPSCLGNLTGLNDLLLDSNSLTGTIPSFLSNLTKLGSLGLSNNTLIGTIPSCLGNLTGLNELDLYINSLTGTIPSSFGCLNALNYLDLHSNSLTGTIPSSVGNLTALIKLDLNSNSLSGTIPSSLGNLTGLINFRIRSNSLTGTIPSSLGSLTGLVNLHLDRNSLTGTIPSSFGSLTELQNLDLYRNSLRGTIPSSLGNLTGLTDLVLYINSLTGTIPSSLGNLTGLNDLLLDSNSLTGTIPSFLGNLTKLGSLGLSNNRLIGTIPSFLGNLTELINIDLDTNTLTGTIPSSLGSLNALNYLDLHSNSLTGSIPSCLGNLTNLKYLDLNSNSLTGTIPSPLGSLAALQYFYLFSNSLTGSISSSLGSLTGLINLDLSSNSLTGTIPSSLGSLTGLTTLYVSSNSLTGTIPSSLGSLTKLYYLDLSDNSLTGTTPSFVGGFTKLQYLAIYSNSLTGTIPLQLANSKNLMVLYLQHNSLDGSIPSTVIGIAGLVSFDASFNTLLSAEATTLFDAIPPSSNLTYINLASIQLTGSLPGSLFNLSKLSRLILSNDCITGTISSSICHATNLTSLIMDGVGIGLHCKRSKQSFHGSIPSCVFALPLLQTLHLAGNGLTGPLSDLAPNSNISEINLANNLLNGTLPRSMQSHFFSNLDLSFNKITGTLIASFQVPTSSLRMNVNRLSGQPPSSLMYLSTGTSLDVLEGNLMGCPKLSNDVNSKSANCGSSNLNASFIVWLSVIVSICCLAAVVSNVSYFHQLPVIVHLRNRLSQWYVVYCSIMINSMDTALYHTRNTIDSLERGSSVSLVLVLFFLLIVMISFIGWTASGHSIYQVQYLYTTTVAYTIGATPVVLIWIYLTLSALVTVLLCVVVSPVCCIVSVATSTNATPMLRIDTEDDETTLGYRDMVQRVALRAGIELVVLLVAIGVNMGYIAIVYFAKPSNIAIVQFASAVIKSLFSSMVPVVTKSLPKSSRQMHALFMTVGVNILSPGIATLFLSPLCLYYKFNPQSISPTYEYQSTVSTCYYNLNVLHCSNVVQYVPASITITPPWNYSYQCSSSFLTSYLPNFVFFYILNGIVFPLTRFILMTIVSKDIILKIKHHMGYFMRNNIFCIGDSTKGDTEIMFRTIGINTIDPVSVSSRTASPHSNDEYTIEASNIMPSMCFDITLLLTFGLASPLLAVLISWSMVINTLLWRLAVGRYIDIVSKEMGLFSCYRQLETALQDEWRCLSRSWWIMAVLVGLFWSLFVNDMIGDRHPTAGVVVAVMMMVWCPLVFVSMQRLLLSIKSSMASDAKEGNGNNDINVSKSPRSMVSSMCACMEITVLQVHEIVWTRLLRVGSVQSASTSATTTEGNKGDVKGKSSTLNETISPLGSLNTTIGSNTSDVTSRL